MKKKIIVCTDRDMTLLPVFVSQSHGAVDEFKFMTYTQFNEIVYTIDSDHFVYLHGIHVDTSQREPLGYDYFILLKEKYVTVHASVYLEHEADENNKIFHFSGKNLPQFFSKTFSI